MPSRLRSSRIRNVLRETIVVLTALCERVKPPPTHGYAMWIEVLMQSQANSPLGMIVPLLLMGVVFWFLILKPQRRQQKEHDAYLGGLKAGDEVVTTGGIFGIVAQIDGTVLTLEIAKNTKIKVLKSQVKGSKAQELETPES